MAVHNAVLYWLKELRSQSVTVLTNNSTVCTYIKHQEGTRSRSLCQRALDLLQLTSAMNITLQVKHRPGRLNVIAEGLS